MLFFIICILGIAQSSITIKMYLDTNKTKDSSFNFSAFILSISLFGLLVSGYMTYRAVTGDAPTETPTNAGNQLATKLENLAEQIKQKNV